MPEVFYYVVAFAAAVLTAAGQLLLKRGADSRRGRHVARLWLNGWTVAGYLVLLLVTVMNLYALKVVPLRMAVILSPLSLLLVTTLSIALFRERLTRMQRAACAIILAGVVVFNL